MSNMANTNNDTSSLFHKKWKILPMKSSYVKYG